ncbi:MAG TPA: GNAT family N-acetyltransferase [Rhizomicrobium sp.]|nr:GNAT family N-acetyltransferase [Rhizomicrobium sp.]
MMLVPAAEGDLEAVAALINSAYRGEASRQGWTTEADFIDGLRTDASHLCRELAAKPGAMILTLRANESGPPLGCLWLEPEERGAWYLGMLSVRPDMQDRGFGRLMLTAAEDFARARGAKIMQMTVIGIREELIAWYRRRGYVPTGEIKPFPPGDGMWTPKRDDLELLVLEKAL